MINVNMYHTKNVYVPTNLLIWFLVSDPISFFKQVNGTYCVFLFISFAPHDMHIWLKITCRIVVWYICLILYNLLLCPKYRDIRIRYHKTYHRHIHTIIFFIIQAKLVTRVENSLPRVTKHNRQSNQNHYSIFDWLGSPKKIFRVIGTIYI